MSKDLPLELSSKLNLDTLEALEEFDAPESHCYVVFGVEGIYVARVLKVDLQPDEVFVKVDDVPDEIFRCCLGKFPSISILLNSNLEGI